MDPLTLRYDPIIGNSPWCVQVVLCCGLCCVVIGVVTISDKLDSLEAPDALDKPLQAFSGNGVVAVDTLR